MTSIIKADNISTVAGTGTISVAAGNTIVQPGMTLQVVQATLTDVFGTTSTSMVDVPGLSVSITPTSASSKILIMMNVSVGGGNGADVNHVYVQMSRNSTPIHIGNNRDSRSGGTSVINTAVPGQMFQANATYLDSPNTTSAVTYKVQIRTSNGANASVNRSGRDNNSAAFDGTAASSITVMEIAQ